MSFGQRIIRLGGYSERLYSFRRVVLNQDMPRPDDLDISCQPRYVKGTSAGNIAQVIHNDDGIQPVIYLNRGSFQICGRHCL